MINTAPNTKKRVSAIVLAAGSGKRMGGSVPKQYMDLCGKPVMVHSLETFAKSSVDEIVLVVAAGDEDYCKHEIVEKYHIEKVAAIVPGGNERYDSVYAGLKSCNCDYVLVHDAARAFITVDVIEDSIRGAMNYDACVVGVLSKDTIKISDSNGFVLDTPNRSDVWIVQTPQAFSFDLLCRAYDKLQFQDKSKITDDAMVVEKMTDTKVKFIMGSYDNIKVTTPEDLILGERILSQRN